jgi:hypothetical protein
MFNKYQIGKNVEGSRHGLIKVLPQHLAKEAEKNYAECQYSWSLDRDLNLGAADYEA